jgi:hypothetical protein
VEDKHDVVGAFLFLHLALWSFLARGESCFGFVSQYVAASLVYKVL